jgi:hypothetical protein
MTGETRLDTWPTPRSSARGLPPSSAAHVPHAALADEDDGIAADELINLDDDEWPGPLGAARLGIP